MMLILYIVAPVLSYLLAFRGCMGYFYLDYDRCKYVSLFEIALLSAIYALLVAPIVPFILLYRGVKTMGKFLPAAYTGRAKELVFAAAVALPASERERWKQEEQERVILQQENRIRELERECGIA